MVIFKVIAKIVLFIPKHLMIGLAFLFLVLAALLLVPFYKPEQINEFIDNLAKVEEPQETITKEF